MTENKRFTLIDGVKKGTHSGIWDNLKQHNQGTGDELWLGEAVAMLNEGVILAEENEQLKQAYTQLKHRHSLLHDECLDAECERDSLKKDVNSLEKENVQLKEQNENYRCALEQCGDYIKLPKVYDNLDDDYKNILECCDLLNQFNGELVDLKIKLEKQKEHLPFCKIFPARWGHYEVHYKKRV